MKKNLYRLSVLVLVLVLLGSGGYILWKHIDYRRGAEGYRAASEAAGLPPVVERPVVPPAASSIPPETAADPLETLLAEVDLEALREVNSGVRAWIVIPDTVLSYPVVQCGDNQYYLNHTWQNKRSSVGAIFMECRCSPDFTDFNTIIYGHRMNNDSMFGILRSYQEENFWQEHPTVYVTTDEGVRVYDVYAAFEAEIREIVYRLDVAETGQEQAFIDFCLERSEIETDIVPAPEDKVLTLSTCTGRGHATRWVVLAVLRGYESSHLSTKKLP